MIQAELQMMPMLGVDDLFNIIVVVVTILASILAPLFKKKETEEEADENRKALAEQRKRQLEFLAQKRQEQLGQGLDGQGVDPRSSGTSSASRVEQARPSAKELSQSELQRRAAVVSEQRKQREEIQRIQKQAQALRQKEHFDQREVERLRAKAAKEREEAKQAELHRIARLKDQQRRSEQRVSASPQMAQSAVGVEQSEIGGAGDRGVIGGELDLRFDEHSVRQAIVMQEILSEPVGMRDEQSGVSGY